MRRTLWKLIGSACLVAAAAGAGAAATGPTPYPEAAGDWPGEGVVRVFGWMKQNRDSFWSQRDKKQGALVLAGDSLLGGWRDAETALKPRPVANRGIGGDVSRGLLFRFQEDVLDLQPSGIVLLIGGNDLSAHQSPDQTVRNVQRMLDAVVAQNPALPVTLCTLLPRDNPEAPTQPGALARLNDQLRQLAGRYPNVRLLDLYPLFLGADGGPQPELFVKDRLHLSGAGYARFGEALKASLEARP